MTVLLVDDEKTVREGLKVIIDWRDHGFDTILEGEDGSDGLTKMIGFSPELTLLDIRMPKMSGLEAAEQARKAGYEGSIIMLSGYSDFKYAQSAIRFGVDAYLLKSIDENELAAAVQTVRENAQRKAETVQMEDKKAMLALNSLLCNILLGRTYQGDALTLRHSWLKSGISRVVLIDFSKNADVCNRKQAEDTFKSFLAKAQAETVTLDGKFVMILKDPEAVSQLPEAVKVARKRAGIPIFAGMGRAVDSLGDIALSYSDASQLVKGRFFNNIDGVICIEDYSFAKRNSSALQLQNCFDKIGEFVEAGEPEKINSILDDLRQQIMTERTEPDKIKGVLSNLHIGLLEKLRQSYPNSPCELPARSEIVDRIFDMEYLDQIINYLTVEFFRVSSGVAGANKDIARKMISYIEKNSSRDLKLESLSELFGYNSTYLGKIFKKAKGESFNTYLDRLRIEKARTLLSDKSLKVYEICEMVGYRNLNYFYKKFKKFSCISPSEYRNNMK